MSESKTTSLIEAYINKGFGSMSKNDFEVWIFHEMLQMEPYKNLSDFGISVILRIPEAKVKRLRYEASLKYPESFEIRDILKKALINARYVKSCDSVKFAINDKFKRQFLYDKLAADGRFFDSSFNSSIISIKGPDLLFLIEQTFSTEEKEKIVNLIRDAVKEKDFLKEKSFADLVAEYCPNLVENLVTRVTEKPFENLTDLIINTIQNLF
ncbi:MAG: hypothetical protein MJZ23_05485 [Paludibacteraceae bacterium]|nr:hypothetical protein [Paludibacteraceae bacterium]